MENTEQYLRHLLQSAVWTTEDKDWLKSYLEGDMAELKAIALKEYEDDMESLTVLLDSRVSEVLLENLHERLQIGNAPKRIRLWPRIAAVAAAVTFIVLGVYFFNAPSRHLDPSLSSRVSRDLSDIAPGKNGATITLANGKVIQLSDAKTGVVIGANGIKYNDGSFLSPSGRDGVAREGSGPVNPLSPQGGSLPEGERSMALTATTAKGQTYQFTLPDGTKVWLNADSKLEFPSNFVNSKTRFVKLSGEGYFEVAKDKAHPFIVKTIGSSKIPEQGITVLGTHFNVNAYEDEGEVKTTLLEGRVALDYGGTDLLLKPGQQARTDIENEIIIKKVEAEEAVAWIDNKYIFEEETIESIMRTLSRWYDVEVVYEGNVKHKKFSGILVRKEYIAKILDQIAFTEAAHFKIEGRRITVMP